MRACFSRKPEGRDGRSRFNLPARSLLLGVVLVMLGLVCGLSAPVEAAMPNPAVFSDTTYAVEAPAYSQFRYDDSTGHGIIGPILRFYTRTGGEDRHGKPLSEPVRTGNHYVQYFERSALEFYPEYTGTGTEVRFANLGRQTAEQNKVDLQPGEPFAGEAGKWFFPGSGHVLGEPFLTFWRNQGDQTELGWPISEEMTQDGPDGGGQMTVQYFENAVLQRPVGSDKIEEVSFVSVGTIQAKKLLKPAQLVPVAKERFTAARVVKVPSLMFHYARLVDEKQDLLGYNLSIKPENYKKFLDWVQDNGYTTVTVGQVYDYLQYGILLPDKPVQFRWDDGHESDWFVYQEMKKRGMTATFYVISQRLELTADQWRQIDQDGFEIGAHTRTHPDLRGAKDLTGEVSGSKKDLEAMLGHPVRGFAYPSGKYNSTVLQVVRNSGYEFAVTTNGGYTWTSDLKFEEPTISVTGQDNVDSFAWKVKLGTAAQTTAAPTAAPAKTTAIQKTAPPTTAKR